MNVESVLAMWQRQTRLGILFVVCLVALYTAVLVGGSTESKRRSLQLRDEVSAADRVVVSVLVTNVNPAGQEFTARLGFRLAGAIAREEVTPATDLQLLVNNVGGQQQYDFPAGKRMNRIEARFPLSGDLNRYPFDRYETTMWLLMTTPAGNAKANASQTPENQPQEALPTDGLGVGASTFQQNLPLPLSLVLSAAIPGIKFDGNVSRNEIRQLTGIRLKMRRADNLIAVSILINAMMSALAISVLAMVLRNTAESGEFGLVPLTIAIALIFGLPALRNVQPGVPPVGAFSDYITFIWAELIVAVSAVITVWHRLLRPQSKPES
ncbi:MAG: DUF4436 family protein [Candidatus Acidiferrum sp.]